MSKENDINHIISKLITNSEKPKLKVLSKDALIAIAQKKTKLTFEILSDFLLKQNPINLPLIRICSDVYLSVIDFMDNDTSYNFFQQLNEYFVKITDVEMLDLWMNICEKFIESKEKAIFAYNHINGKNKCTKLIILKYCIKYIYDEIIDKLNEVQIINSKYFFEFIDELTKYVKSPNSLLSKSFPIVFQQFIIDEPTKKGFSCLLNIFNSIYPNACPISFKKMIIKLVQNIEFDALNDDLLMEYINLFINFSINNEFLQLSLHLILKIIYFVHSKQIQQEPTEKRFVIISTDVKPFFFTKVLSYSIESIISLSKLNKDAVLTFLLSKIDTKFINVIFQILSSLINNKNIKYDKEQIQMIISSIIGITSRKSYTYELCQLSIDILRFYSLSLINIISLVSYITDSSIVLQNSYFYLQLLETNESNISSIFDLVCEHLFEDNKIQLIPSTNFIINKYLEKQNDKHYYVHESFDDDSSKVLHPLVSLFMKKTIEEKCIFLLCEFSILFSLVPSHQFLDSVISNLKIFFDFSFPMSFKETKSIIDSITNIKDNNNLIHVLSDFLKLINDHHFRLSLCSTIINEVKNDIYDDYTFSCLKVFNSLVSYLPEDFAFSSFEKLFSVYSFSNPILFKYFTEFIGNISSTNPILIFQIFEKWLQNKLNSIYIGKNHILVSNSFIASILFNAIKEISVKSLILKANEIIFPLIHILTNNKEINSLLCLSIACKKLSYHQNLSYTLQSFDYFLNYILHVFQKNNYKQKTILHLTINALQYLIQVPPCLTFEKFKILKNKVLTNQLILYSLNDNTLFEEVSNLLLSILYVLPKTYVLISFMELLMKFYDKEHIINLISKLASLLLNENSKFYVPYQHEKISILPILICDLIALSYNEKNQNEEFKIITFLYQIDRNSKEEFKDINQLLLSLTKEEIHIITEHALKLLYNHSINHSYVISLILKLNIFQKNIEIAYLYKDLLNEKIVVVPEFIQQLIIVNCELFVKNILLIGCNLFSCSIIKKALLENECVELLIQHFSLILINSPKDDNQSFITLSFVDIILRNSKIPLVHLYQLIMILLIFGFSSNNINQINSLFINEIQAFKLIKSNDSNIIKTGIYTEVLKLAYSKICSDPLDFNNAQILFDKIIHSFYDIDSSLLVDIMNFLMTSSNLNNPKVSSGIAIFCGETLRGIPDFSEKSAEILNLYFSTLLSFGNLFGSYTSICCVNEIIKFFQKDDILFDKFDYPLQTRTLNTFFKICMTDSITNIYSVVVGIHYFCLKFSKGFDKNIHQFLFGIIIELCNKNAFANDINLITIIEDILNSDPIENRNKYYIIHKLISFHYDEKISSKRNEKEFDFQSEQIQNDLSIVLNLFLESSNPWMISSAIKFLERITPKMIPNYIQQLIEFISSSDENISIEATKIIKIMFEKEN